MPGLYKAGDYDLAGFAVGAVERDAIAAARRRGGRRGARARVLGPALERLFARAQGGGDLRAALGRALPVRCRRDAGRSDAGADAHLCALLPRGDPRDRRREGARAHHRRRVHREHSARAARRTCACASILRACRFCPCSGGSPRPAASPRAKCCARSIAVSAWSWSSSPAKADAVADVLAREGETVTRLGEVVAASARRAARHLRRPPRAVMTRKRVAILISGRGSNMAALIEAAKAPDYPAEIALVVSNVPDAAGLARAREAGVATAVLDHKPFGKDRAAFETALQKILDEHRIDLICLAGFMRLFTAEFVQRWSGRMLNIHPSLLPLFPGLDPHGRRCAPARKHPARPCISSSRNRCRPDHRAGERAGASGRHAGDARRARAGGRAPHLSARAQAGRRGNDLAAETKPPAARSGATGLCRCRSYSSCRLRRP